MLNSTVVVRAVSNDAVPNVTLNTIFHLREKYIYLLIILTSK